jgi:hypothetical protein
MVRERSLRVLSCVVAIVLSVAMAACGDGNGSAAGDDAGADAPIGGVLVVHVTAWPEWGVGGAGAATPGSGAVVALDAPGGARVEQTAGADGRVTFTGLDWSAGTAAVTAYLDDAHVMATRVGVTEADGEVPMPLDSLGSPELVEVNVTAHNLQNPTNGYVMAAATVQGIQCQGSSAYAPVDPSCTLEVIPGQAFTIVARAGDYLSCGARCLSEPIFSWATVDVPALTGPTDATLDFAAPATATTVAGAFAMPGRADSPLRSDTSCLSYTLSAAGGAYVGLATSSRVTADGSTCEDEGQFVGVAGVDAPMTIYWVTKINSQAHEADSWVEVPGNLVAGPQTLPFLDAPAFVTVAGSPLHGPLEWTLFDAGVSVSLIFSRSDAARVWRVAFPQVDATTLTLPQPAASVDVSALLGDGDLTANLYVYRKNDATGVLAEATAAAITLTR